MKKARIVIGANYGDEGKGTVVASYTKKSENVLNILTNGGCQRGHSILTENGNITFHHFGAGTYHGADNYYSRFFILNPMQFVKEYNSLIVKPNRIYRDRSCRWSTPYDVIANQITEELQNRHASCGMGIWNTIKRHSILSFDNFLNMKEPFSYLENVKQYYEKQITIPDKWKDIWNSLYLKEHFLMDCKFLYKHTIVSPLSFLYYDNLIFENGQGLLLCDTGKDTFDTTPSNTGIKYSLELLKDISDVEITAHYVTRPYLTRHGDGNMLNVSSKENLSKEVEDDRTNHYNNFQGQFRYGFLNICDLKKRILSDNNNIPFEIELTHCDEMDRKSEFERAFSNINFYESPLI